MKKSLKVIAVAAILCVLLLATSCVRGATTTNHIYPNRVAFVVSFDGLASAGLQAAKVPNFIRLAQKGSVTLTAQVDPPSTLPSHATMLSGLTPAHNGVSWNSYNSSKGPFKFPTIFTLAAQAGYTTALYAAKDKFRHFAAPSAITILEIIPSPGGSVATQTKSDAKLVNSALKRLHQAKNGLIFLHINVLDFAGHQYGWMSPQYIEGVEAVDGLLGQIITAVEAEEVNKDILLLVTADHGGHDKTHGVASRTEDRLVPWFVSQPQLIQKGRQIKAAVNSRDTAAVVLKFLGIPWPKVFDGRDISEIWR